MPTPHPMIETIATTPTKLHTPMPAARMAVISLSAASRLSPSRMPTSTAMGMVTVNMLGSVRRKISTTVPRDALLRTTSSRRCGRSRMNNTKVKSAPPMKACESTSFRMYRVRMRTESSLLDSLSRESLQTQTIGQHAHGAESHGGAGDRGVKQESGEGIEDSGGDRDAEQVVTECPAQVLAHHAQGVAGQRKCRHDLSRVAAQQNRVSSFAGEVGAGS